MFIIELIPKMASMLNDFMLEYGKIFKRGDFDQSELFKFHNDITMQYSIKVIKLVMEYVDNEQIEKDFNNWLEKHSAKK